MKDGWLIAFVLAVVIYLLWLFASYDPLFISDATWERGQSVDK